jgi:hypothetical protein
MKEKQKLQAARLNRLAPSNRLVSRFELVIGALHGERWWSLNPDGGSAAKQRLRHMAYAPISPVAGPK